MSEFKYEPIFGDQSLFDGAEPDVFWSKQTAYIKHSTRRRRVK